MSAAEIAVEAARDIPRIYVACPLTGLDVTVRRQIGADVRIVKHTVDAFTVGDRIEEEQWPVVVYAPIDSTAPWKKDGLGNSEVYRRNLDAVHSADALIAVAEKGGSAGVGQELEWATRLGIPILYLTADHEISRQILGTPCDIQAQAYGNDSATLELHVKNFLARWKTAIVDGPRRRQARHLRFIALARRLQAAWASCSNPTAVAAQVRVRTQYLEVALSDPVLLSVMPFETVTALAHELDVDLQNQMPRHAVSIPVPAMRSLFGAAEAEGWSDRDIERLIFHGRAALERGDAVDLATISAWRSLYEDL